LVALVNVFIGSEMLTDLGIGLALFQQRMATTTFYQHRILCNARAAF